MATRLKSIAIRLTLPLAVIGMTAVGAVSPAHAEPEAAAAERPQVEIFVPDRVVTTAGAVKPVPFEVINAGKTAATGLVVEFASTAFPIDARLGFQPPAGCTVAGCTVGDLAPGARKAYTFTVRPTAQLPAAGATLTLSVRDAGATWREPAPVTVVRGLAGIDLEVAPIPDIKLAAGKSAVLPIQVRNNGDKATEGVAVALAGQQYITFPNNYSNCVDVKELPGILCVFDLALEPGSVFTIGSATPLTVVADAVAPGPADYRGGMNVYGLNEVAKDAELAAATKAARKPGTKLQLVPVARTLAVDESELNTWDNTTSFLVKVGLNPADSVAIGDTFEGKVGAVGTVTIGFRNAGPAAMLGKSAKWSHSAQVRTPAGLTLTKVDKRCVPDGAGDPSWDKPGKVSGRDYLCVAPKRLGAGSQVLFTFSGKIKDAKTKGSIKVLGGVQDPKKANDTAEVTVKVTAAGTGGTGGGGLAITGAPTGRLAGVGLLFVLVGAMALVLTRPRRTV